MKQRKIIMKQSIDCIDCGKHVSVNGPNVKRCEECRIIHKKKYDKERRISIVNGSYILNKNCIDCGIPLMSHKKRCNDCNKKHIREQNKTRNKARYVITKRETSCVDCDIFLPSFQRQRCSDCQNKRDSLLSRSRYQECSDSKRKSAQKRHVKVRQQKIMKIISSINEGLKSSTTLSKLDTSNF